MWQPEPYVCGLLTLYAVGQFVVATIAMVRLRSAEREVRDLNRTVDTLCRGMLASEVIIEELRGRTHD